MQCPASYNVCIELVMKVHMHAINAWNYSTGSPLHNVAVLRPLHNTHNCSALISFKINRKIRWICRDHQDYFTVQNRKQCKEHSTHFSQGVPTDSTDCSVEVVLPDEQRHRVSHADRQPCGFWFLPDKCDNVNLLALAINPDSTASVMIVCLVCCSCIQVFMAFVFLFPHNTALPVLTHCNALLVIL